ncbi:MAG: hypothetical protein HYT75_01870 [Deltaproteobacteria bacterium]|nr:hypothetical protein [Deltaproteobacteria bacterium]
MFFKCYKKIINYYPHNNIIIFLDFSLKKNYHDGMARVATLSTIIDADVKKAVTNYCNEHGLKLRYIIEQALIEQFEDAIDLKAYRARQGESTVSLERILSRRRKSKK